MLWACRKARTRTASAGINPADAFFSDFRLRKFCASVRTALLRHSFEKQLLQEFAVGSHGLVKVDGHIVLPIFIESRGAQRARLSKFGKRLLLVSRKIVHKRHIQVD